MSQVARRVAPLLAWAAFVLELTPVVQIAVGAHTNHNPLNFWEREGDQISPYDFTDKVASSDGNGVDFAVDVFFTRNAEINRVKSNFQDQAKDFGYDLGDIWQERDICCGPMNGLMKETGASQLHFDTDSGMKTSLCGEGVNLGWGGSNALHYRIYAPPGDDRIFNQSMGWWVYATTHIDHRECGGEDWSKPPFDEGKSKWSGRSEKAEYWLAVWARYFFGNRHVHEDAIGMGNAENRQETGHWWENDGMATKVEVCFGGNIPCSTDDENLIGSAVSTTTVQTVDQVLHGSPGLISLHGTLRANNGAAMANKTIHIEFDNREIAGWKDAFNLTTQTNGQGNYQYRDFGIAPGWWDVRSRYGGDLGYNGSQSGPESKQVKKGYEIVARHTGHCLTLNENWKNYNGQAYIQWACSRAPGQVFSLWEPYGNGWYNIRPNGYPNKCVDVRDVSLTNGAWIQSWDCYGANQNNQIWRREPIQGEDGYYGLMPRHAWNLGLYKCMDVTDRSQQDGVHIQLWDCLWGFNQRWFLRGIE